MGSVKARCPLFKMIFLRNVPISILVITLIVCILIYLLGAPLLEVLLLGLGGLFWAFLHLIATPRA